MGNMGKWDRPKNENYKLSQETADAELRRVLDFYEVGADDAQGDEAKAAIESAFDELALAFRRGELEIDDTEKGFNIIQHLKNGETLTYRELRPVDQKVLEKFDRRKEAQQASFAIMGRLAGYGEDAIRLLKGQDKATALGLSLIFFMA